MLVEFVSTNPTGPLHVGHGRGAVIGDVVARLLEVARYDVMREYYVNDAGKQIDTLGRSALARLRQAYGEQVELPEDGYPGDYLRDLVSLRRDDLTREIAAAFGRPVPGEEVAPGPCRRRGARRCGLRLDDGQLAPRTHQGRHGALAVEIDSFVSERALSDAASSRHALEALENGALLYRQKAPAGSALPPSATRRTVSSKRSNGELTYFAADIGYHRQKLERGFDELIDVWGADHHGYVKRVSRASRRSAAIRGAFRVILVQIVRLTRGGEPVRMGKRTGEFVTLHEVVDEVGADATRFFFLMRKAD